MDINKISSGKDLPNNCNVVIEISANAGPIKYEFCKDSGMLMVDRVMQTTMSYPCNYGFIPHTLSGDGDPVDVLVHTNFPLALGSVISVKPIGVLVTEDEKGSDEKILAVPTDKIDPFFAAVNDISDVPQILLEKITHFFENYKKLEKGKWVKLVGWKDSSTAKEIILASVERYKTTNN